MLVTLTNETSDQIPVVASSGGHLLLEPGQTVPFAWPDNVIVVGDKPDVSDQILEGLGTFARTLLDLIHLRRADPKKAVQDLIVTIVNNDTAHSQRVILGDGVTDITLAPNESYRAVSPGYIELRTLGLVSDSVNEQPAVA